MEPLTSAAATSALKGAGTSAGKLVFSALTKRTVRPRVAFAASKIARSEGVVIGWRDLAAWLKDEEVRDAIADGRLDALHQFVRRLGIDEMYVARLVDIVRDESLRRMSDGDARVTQTRRLEELVASSELAPRQLLTSGGDELAFANALDKLHPWRSASAQEIAAHWPPLRALVVTLAGERDRAVLLQQWIGTSLSVFEDMPAEGWCWLGSVAADYGAVDASLEYVSRGIHAGAPPSYWWARAGMTAAGAGDSKRARLTWARSIPKHPLAAAGEALEDEDYSLAEQLLDRWTAEGANEESIKSILQSAAAAGQRDFDRAIAIGMDAAVLHPEGSGNTLRTAEALISRAHYGPTNHALDDLARAYELAIQARDSRRTWRGDSVAPILTAVKASALATNIDQAWRLTQAAPEGTALPHEASDTRLQRESAILAATMGRFDNARSIAEVLNDPFVSYTVEGWKAFAEDRPSDAEQAWLQAWDSAPDDTARLQAAAAIAPLGMRLPNLASLPEDSRLAVERIRTTHEVMSNDDDMSLLRVRATESEELTVLLAERLVAQDDVEDAARVLEGGGNRWSHPLLMRMAAARYESAGNYAKAFEVAGTALSLGGGAWAGRLETLMIQFNALESMGEFTRSLAVARELVTLAPDNITVRWALVHSLVRAGTIEDAWRALRYQGRPLAPRSATDARTWIGLAAECDDSVEFVQHSLEMMTNWLDDPDTTGVFLIQIYRGLSRHDRDIADADIAELHKATEEFTEAHPENEVFWTVSLDETDPLGSLTELLRQQNTQDPAIAEIRAKVECGDLPLGLAAELTNRTYVEACIKTGAGRVYSHIPAAPAATVAKDAATAALDKRVVIDASTAATLSLLDQAVSDRLVGAFLALQTTDSAYRDALSAQQSLNMLSTMTLGWNPEQDRPQITETSLEDAQAFATRGDLVVELMARSERRSWPGLKRYTELASDGAWLSALDLAASEGLAFWCDDRSLRQLAGCDGVPTFGTVDLLEALEATNRLNTELGSTLRGTLVSAYHVDLDFDLRVMTHAAELDGWRAKGAAAALTRRHSWADAVACVQFASAAIDKIADVDPLAIAHWTAAAGLGLVRITDGDIKGADGNLEILLTHLFAQPWLRPDTLPFVMQGIRTALEDLPGTTNPLSTVLEKTYARTALKHGAPQAAEFIVMLVAQLDEEDRVTAARVILTTPR